MALPLTAGTEDFDLTRGRPSGLSSPLAPLTSAVSWAAIAAGAAAAASLSLILLILGVGLGLSSVSPWASDGISAATFGTSTILWLTLTQVLASAMGGYLAGRLRTKWTDAPVDEVYFRDTAHGFLAWALASLATAALLTSVISSILGGGVQIGASVAGGVASTARAAESATAAPSGAAQGSEGGPLGYFVDSLFRRDATAATEGAGSAAAKDANERSAGRDAAEVARIFLNVGRSQPLPPDDLRYIAQLVVQRTGLSQPAAEKRVAEVHARAQARLSEAQAAARDAADKARKSSAHGALWLFVSLLMGAFVASLAATFGGRCRDA